MRCYIILRARENRVITTYSAYMVERLAIQKPLTTINGTIMYGNFCFNFFTDGRLFIYYSGILLFRKCGEIFGLPVSLVNNG